MDAPAPELPAPPPTETQVVRDLAFDLQQALARNGRAPFVLSGRPMFEDLQALRQTLGHCLTLREDPHLRHWYSVLRRQLGVSELREPLLRRGAWAVLQYDVASPAALRERLAQVRWQTMQLSAGAMKDVKRSSGAATGGDINELPCSSNA